MPCVSRDPDGGGDHAALWPSSVLPMWKQIGEASPEEPAGTQLLTELRFFIAWSDPETAGSCHMAQQLLRSATGNCDGIKRDMNSTTKIDAHDKRWTRAHKVGPSGAVLSLGLVPQKGGLSCPTCRQLAPVRDITVVGPRAAEQGDGAASSNRGIGVEEASIAVRGSYGTKVTLDYRLHNRLFLVTDHSTSHSIFEQVISLQKTASAC